MFPARVRVAQVLFMCVMCLSLLAIWPAGVSTSTAQDEYPYPPTEVPTDSPTEVPTIGPMYLPVVENNPIPTPIPPTAIPPTAIPPTAIPPTTIPPS